MDSQYQEIKQKVIAFRESGIVLTREEKKKTYTLLTGYANNWNIFILDEKSTNEIKIVRYCEDFKNLVISRLGGISDDKILSDEEFKEIIADSEDYFVRIKEWEEKYGLDGRVLVTHQTRSKQVQDAFRNRLISYYGKKCLLCDICNKEMLIASHIKRDADCESIEEKVDNNNGLLLCANHDKVFDRHLITFDFIDGSLKMSKSLTEKEKEILLLESNYTLPDDVLTDRTRGYLVFHNEEFEKKELERVAAI